MDNIKKADMKLVETVLNSKIEDWDIDGDYFTLKNNKDICLISTAQYVFDAMYCNEKIGEVRGYDSPKGWQWVHFTYKQIKTDNWYLVWRKGKTKNDHSHLLFEFNYRPFYVDDYSYFYEPFTYRENEKEAETEMLTILKKEREEVFKMLAGIDEAIETINKSLAEKEEKQ